MHSPKVEKGSFRESEVVADLNSLEVHGATETLLSKNMQSQ